MFGGVKWGWGVDKWINKIGSQLIKKMDITNRWENREISNFQYLMWINTLAGRTYNDLTQYPIFPWIIADYESEKLDLNDAKSYRDLSKPIGALNEDRLTYYIQRYEEFEDPQIPKFYYGSHYSNVGVVLNYLVREEPFTSYSLQLQDGQFDYLTRMFVSIKDTWRGCLMNTSDVKELIPEFFYHPEFLINKNKFLFGKLKTNKSKKKHEEGGEKRKGEKEEKEEEDRNGEERKEEEEDQRLNFDVELPKWAKSAEDFIGKNQQALESEYVSSHIHEWIDLIFGYKQRGQAAIENYNVFYYLTYEGVIDIDSIEDPITRSSIESQIINFGQTPSQLFDKPHPRRKTMQEIKSKYLNKQVVSLSYDILPLKLNKPIVFLQYQSERLVLVTIDGVIGSNSFSPKSDKSQIFQFDYDKSMYLKSARRIDMIYPEPIQFPSKCFTTSKDGKYLFACSMWSDDIQVFQIAPSGSIKKIDQIEHRDIVTTLQMLDDGKTLISASKDCTVIVWNVNLNQTQSSTSLSSSNSNTINSNASNSASSTLSQLPVSLVSSLFGVGGQSNGNINNNASNTSSSGSLRPSIFKLEHILYGHTDTITTIDGSVDLDLVISGSNDHSVIISSLHKGKYIRSLYFNSPISQVKLSNDGYFAVYCSTPEPELYLYSINGDLIARKKEVLSRLFSILFTPDSKYLITSGVGDMIIVRSVPNLQIIHMFEVGATTFSVDYVPGLEYSFIVAALVTGQIRVFPFEPSRFLTSPSKLQ